LGDDHVAGEGHDVALHIQRLLIGLDVNRLIGITLYGTTFNSSGLKMRGNLRSKNAELIEKVRTSYGVGAQRVDLNMAVKIQHTVVG
jgi:hypothetical protein